MQLSIASDVTGLIGHTPLVRLNRFGEGGPGARSWPKWNRPIPEAV